MKRYPGKFEGCADQTLGETLQAITLDGCCDDLGDVENFGWYASVDHDGRFFIVSEDSQGFFDYEEFETAAARDTEWSNVETAYAEYLAECEGEI